MLEQMDPTVVDMLHPDLDTRAIEFLADRRFHQSFMLPTSTGSGQRRITYSDYGYRNLEEPERENVVLFCGPMLGSRYLHLAKDQLAKKYRVRIINPDRPGLGGSAEVSSEYRVQVWLEIVPALLEHLHITHVSLVCHSGGTIYALNTLLYLRSILHPTRPYVAICAPWVHPSHTGVPTMQMMKIFPNQLIGNLDWVAQVFHNRISPITGYSSNLLSKIGPPSSTVSIAPIADGGDVDVITFEERLRPTLIDYAYAENIQGISQEALLLLKRRRTEDWGLWEDYDRYVPMLASLENEVAETTVEVYFAEDDSMIGNSRGPQWFNDCWRLERRGERIQYTSSVVKGTDHDGVLDLRYGLAEQIFRKISELG